MSDEQTKNKDEYAEVADSDEVDFEIIDDTPEEDRDAPEGKRKPPDDDDKNEAEEYSERVQKRIKQLTWERHEARREKEEAERIRDEAVSFADRQRKELENYRKKLKDGTGQAFTQAEKRIEAEKLNAKRELREALDSGDSERAVDAQEKLSSLAAEKARLEAYQETAREREESSREQEVEAEKSEQREQRKPPKPSDAAQEWAKDNPWFNSDPKMTAFAFGVHEDLIRNQGVKPDTQEYYESIDKEMRKVFPSYFDDGRTDDDTPATVVAAPSRKAPRKPRTIRLTQTQVKLAKRLGITPEAYAAELAKEQG